MLSPKSEKNRGPLFDFASCDRLGADMLIDLRKEGPMKGRARGTL